MIHSYRIYCLMMLLSIFQVQSRFVNLPNMDTAKIARIIVHSSDWISLATISTKNDTKDYPFVSLKSVSDGPINNSSGTPYLYMTDMDVSGKDVKINNKVSLLATLAETSYCKDHDLDAQDPRCAKVFVTGKLIKLKDWEQKFAKTALFERHPQMKTWPDFHNFYFAKVEIEIVDVIDAFGGLKHVSLNDYFNANVTEIINCFHFTSSNTGGAISLLANALNC